MTNISKIVLLNSSALLIISLGLAIFDSMLELEGFRGLVFSLYLAYASGLLAVINLVLAFVSWRQNKIQRLKGYLIGGTLIPLVGIGIAYFGGGLW